MKRISYIILFASAVLAVCGCQKSPETGPVKGGIISFNPTVGGIQDSSTTKAVDLHSDDDSVDFPMWLTVSNGIEAKIAGNVGGEAAPLTKGEQLNTTGEDKKLSIYSTLIGDKFFVTGWNGATPFMPAASGSYEKVTYANSAWSTENEYKWDGKNPLDFFAYANLPANESGVVEAAIFCTANGPKMEEKLQYSVVPAAAVLQNDILMGYGNISVAPAANQKTCTPDLEFFHPLTAVRFKVGDIGGTEIKFKGIYLSRIYKSGTATIDASSAAETDTDDKFVWTNLSSEMQEAVQEFSSGITVAKGNIIGVPFIIIPQVLTANPVTATVVIEIDGVTYPLTFNPTSPSGKWEAGKTYTYNLGYEVDNSTYTFTLVTSTDATQTFSNTSSSEQKYISINSYKTGEGGVRTDVGWSVKSIKVGSGETEPIESSGFSGKGGLSSSVELTEKRLSLTALARTICRNVGSNDFWKNKDGISGDTAGTLLSPKSWASKGVIDLSKYNYKTEEIGGVMNTANCYIIRHAGTYKLPLVYGNGVENGNVNTRSYAPAMAVGGEPDYFLSPFVNHLGNGITSPFIENNTGCEAYDVSVEKYDKSEIIKSLQIVPAVTAVTPGNYNKDNVRYLQFMISQDDICQNNAVIAVKDVSGKVMWSWHIWTTNDPALLSDAITVTNFAGNEYDFFALGNLGCLDPDMYDPREDVKIVLIQEDSGYEIEITVSQPSAHSTGFGCTYQFGRKDPVLYSDPVIHTYYGTGASIAQTIEVPKGFYDFKSVYCPNWCKDNYFNLWTGQFCETGALEQSDAMIKTIYDPSPVGYKVPASKAFTGFTTTGDNSSIASEFNVDGSFDEGWNFYTKPGKQGRTIYFPAQPSRTYDGGSFEIYFNSYWSAVSALDDQGYLMSFYKTNIRVTQDYPKASAASVRSVIDTTMPNNPME